jgi:glycosyltransferase involved in cell wall biosynthesis
MSFTRVEFIFQLIFWSSFVALLYSYVGYAIVLVLLSRLRGRGVKSEDFTPTISFIITAYNEERDLAAKLRNTLALDYPKDKFEIIVASDCSSDRTDEIARSFANEGVRLHRQLERLGKTAAQNRAVELATGDVILFSDATTLYRPDVLRVISRNFADETIGCVAGQLIYVDPSNSSVGKGAVSYWNYEVFLKRHESNVRSLIGVSGCLYAVRRSAYVPLYHEACSDFIIATKMVEQGLRTIYEPDAICEEETNSRADKEFRMRVRVITQTYNDLWRHRHIFNPFRYGVYALQLFSHKVMRYLVPVFLAMLFISSLVLATRSLFFAFVLVLQLAGYAAALVGYLLERTGLRGGLISLPHYFLLANLAAVVAFYEFVRGERYAKWEPIRETGPAGPEVPRASNEEVATLSSLPDGPQVSVIIPAYNAAGFIEDAVSSVLAQTFSDYELIVVNDGSPDSEELARVLSPYSDRIIYLEQQNRGPSGARNAAIEIAKSKYLALLDSDDTWLPNYLTEQMKFLNQFPETDMVYADALLVGEGPLVGKSFMQSSPSIGPVTFESLLRYESSVITSCSVINREKVIAAGLFDERFVRCEDFDLWIRLAHQGARIRYQTQVLARHRISDASLAADQIRMVESQIEVLKKAQQTLPLTPEQLKLVDGQLANCAAQIDLAQGKRFFDVHDYEQAAQRLRSANNFYKSRKLQLIVWGLQSAPWFLSSLNWMRQNLWSPASKTVSK